MTLWKPVVGQRVRLSRNGYTQLRLSCPEEARAAIEGMTVTNVTPAYTVPECWNVDVDGPLAPYVLTSADVEPTK